MDIGNMHKNLVKIAHLVLEISSRTDRQTYPQTYLSEYFATSAAAEVNIMRTKVNAGKEQMTKQWRVV